MPANELPDELADGQEEPRHSATTAWLKTWAPILLPLLAPIALLVIYAWERGDDELEAKFLDVKAEIARSTETLGARIDEVDEKLDNIRESNERRLFRLEGYHMDAGNAPQGNETSNASLAITSEPDAERTEL